MWSSSSPKGLHGILDHFSELKDPRGVGRCEYPLETVLLIAMLGVLCGAEGWTDLALFAASKHAWLCTFLTLPIQPPREGVFRRVFSAIRPVSRDGLWIAVELRVATLPSGGRGDRLGALNVIGAAPSPRHSKHPICPDSLALRH